MKHLDLFSGIGGFAYAVDQVWPGAEHIFCEIDSFCQNVLKKHWPEAVIYGDIRKLTADTYNRGPERKELKATRDKQCGFRVDLLTGGFPCQPFSQAGKRKGKGDDRFLWPEMLRIIREFRPTWIIGENVAGIVSMAQRQGETNLESETDNEINDNNEITSDGILCEILDSLQSIGYAVQAFVIPAVAVGACHRRDRIWIVAYSKGCGHRGSSSKKCGDDKGKMEPEKQSRDQVWSESKRCVSNDSHSGNQGLQGNKQPRTPGKGKGASRSTSKCAWDENWIEVATRLCTLDDGLRGKLVRLSDGRKISHARWRVEALKAAGNSIVPQVAIEIMRGINEIKD